LLDSSLSLKAHMGNKYLPLSLFAVLILQLLFTYTAPFQAMFGNEAIPLRIRPWLLAGGLVFFLVETEKFIGLAAQGHHLGGNWHIRDANIWLVSAL
jgi:hypothetical protein